MFFVKILSFFAPIIDFKHVSKKFFLTENRFSDKPNGIS